LRYRQSRWGPENPTEITIVTVELIAYGDAVSRRLLLARQMRKIEFPFADKDMNDVEGLELVSGRRFKWRCLVGVRGWIR